MPSLETTNNLPKRSNGMCVRWIFVDVFSVSFFGWDKEEREPPISLSSLIFVYFNLMYTHVHFLFLSKAYTCEWTRHLACKQHYASKVCKHSLNGCKQTGI